MKRLYKMNQRTQDAINSLQNNPDSLVTSAVKNELNKEHYPMMDIERGYINNKL